MIRQVAVIGSGTMGRGIAYLSAVAGYETVIHDVDSGALDAARANIESTLRKGVEKGKVEQSAADAAAKRIQLVNDLEPAVRQADLIIEAVPEDLDLKLNLFSQADVFCGEETILAAEHIRLRKEIQLQIEVLRHGLDDQIRLADGWFEIVHQLNALRCCIGSRLFDLSLLHAFSQRRFDVGPGGVERSGIDVVYDGLISGDSGEIRDSAAHRPAPD